MKVNDFTSRIIILAAFLGVTGVSLGAFGAHALQDHLTDSGRLETWETAVLYHLVHTVALLALAGLRPGPYRRWVAGFWGFGVLVFSGSLYILCLTGLGRLGTITPIGGVALLAGWAWLGISAWNMRSKGKVESQT